MPRTWSPLAWVVVALLGAVALAALFDVLGASRSAEESSPAPIGSVGTTGSRRMSRVRYPAGRSFAFRRTAWRDGC